MLILVALRAALAVLVLATSLACAVAAQAAEAATVRIPFPRDPGTLTPLTFTLGYPLLTLVYDTIMLVGRGLLGGIDMLFSEAAAGRSAPATCALSAAETAGRF